MKQIPFIYHWVKKVCTQCKREGYWHREICGYCNQKNNARPRKLTKCALCGREGRWLHYEDCGRCRSARRKWEKNE